MCLLSIKPFYLTKLYQSLISQCLPDVQILLRTVAKHFKVHSVDGHQSSDEVGGHWLEGCHSSTQTVIIESEGGRVVQVGAGETGDGEVRKR